MGPPPPPPRRFGAQADTIQWPNKPKVNVLRGKQLNKGGSDRYLVLQQDTAASMLPALRGQGMAKSGLI